MKLTPEELLRDLTAAWQRCIDGYGTRDRQDGFGWFKDLEMVANERGLFALPGRAKAAAELEKANRDRRNAAACSKARRD